MCHHAATRAPPRALSRAQAGTGRGLIFPCPVMQRGLDPRDLIPEDGSLGLAPRGWIPVHGSQGTLQCRTSLLQKAQQPLPGGVQGARQRLCKGRRVSAAAPLVLSPCGCCHTWPGLRAGLATAATETTPCWPRLLQTLVPEQWMLQSWGSTGLFPPLFPPKEQGAAARGAQPSAGGGSCPGSQLGACGWGGRAGCRGSRQRCSICFSSGCWGCWGCDRWSVYQLQPCSGC